MKAETMKRKIEIEYSISFRAFDGEISRYAWTLEDAEKYLRALSLLLLAEGPGVGPRCPCIEIKAELVEMTERAGEKIYVPAIAEVEQ